jgi:tRNA-modifying protein YgfZ
VSDLPSPLANLRRDGGYYALGLRTSFRITGEDRIRYLNGQVSNDLGKLVPGSACHALILTAKGKLCAEVFIWAEGDSLRIDADPAVADSLPARLERYAVADDVDFDWQVPSPRYHVFGPAAALCDGLQVRRLGVKGVDLDDVPPGPAEATPEQVECLRIERGVPRWGFELGENTLPQEAGLERTAVDFHKGCYVGQEVVSRIQSVGRTNRSLCGFLGNFDPANCRSATLLSPAGAKSGTLESAIFHPDLQKSIALGYLDRRSEGESFSVFNESGACLGEAERSEFPLVS